MAASAASTPHRAAHGPARSVAGSLTDEELLTLVAQMTFVLRRRATGTILASSVVASSRFVSGSCRTVGRCGVPYLDARTAGLPPASRAGKKRPKTDPGRGRQKGA